MLITVSGSVGSGKTTVAAHVIRVLEREGVSATEWRFQSLPCFTFLKPQRASRAPEGVESPAKRWTGYRRKPLTARVALGYVARILAFRVFRRWRGSRGCYISNRYFYDNLVHYRLETTLERLYVAVLRTLVPTPDLAILLVASPETIAARRPQYATEYVSSLQEAYKRLHAQFPALVEISTDLGQPTLERVEQVLRLGHCTAPC